MKKKYIILASVLFLFNLTPISAACTEEELKEFKKIEDKYTVKYEIDKSTKTYNLYFNSENKNKFSYRIYADNDFECNSIDDKKTKCKSFPNGEYEIIVVGQTQTCNSILKTINLKLPKYNIYADDQLCDGIEDFVLCNPTYDKDIDYNTFVSRVNTYKKNHREEKKEETFQNKPTKVVDKGISYLKEHMIEIIVITLFTVLILITIVLTIKQHRKSRRLE